MMMGDYPLSDYKPIPLTEEWLIKFGFIRYNYTLSPVFMMENFWEIQYNALRKIFRIDDIEVESEQIKYVHQLQNLYFALTGEELTTKE